MYHNRDLLESNNVPTTKYNNVPAPNSLLNPEEVTILGGGDNLQGDNQPDQQQQKQQQQRRRADDTAPEAPKPRNIKEEHWTKLQELRNKRLQAADSNNTNNKRKNKRKQDDISTQREDRSSDKMTEKRPRVPSSSLGAGAQSSGADKESWQEVQRYININPQLKGVHHGSAETKRPLEKAIDEAIAKGDYNTASRLSDQLFLSDAAKKWDAAIAARDYDKQRTQAAETSRSKKKARCAWTFESKQRWERKANM